jgi:hypothetical protein
MCFIVENLGFGDEICSMRSRANDRIMVLTSTGIALVLDENKTVITAYVANMRLAAAIWKRAHNYLDNIRMPHWLYLRILANKGYYEDCQRLNVLFGYHEEKNVSFF